MDSLTEKKKRVYFIDIIRGILIIYVVYYHFMYDLNDILGHEIPYLYSVWFSTIRDCMSGSLIFISGISCNFSKNNLKRGVRTILIAMVLTLVTLTVMPSQTIIFGILHLLGTMMFLYGIAQYVIHRASGKRSKGDDGVNEQTAAVKKYDSSVYIRLVFMIIFFVLFFVCRNIHYGWLELGFVRIDMPALLYGGKNMFLYIMGFAQRLSSADYYPVIPWGFLFLAGAMGGHIFKKKNLPGFLYKNFCRPLAFIGRHTMIIYVVHQPLLFGIFMIISAIKG